jgi:hypothetical protein
MKLALAFCHEHTQVATTFLAESAQDLAQPEGKNILGAGGHGFDRHHLDFSGAQLFFAPADF